jgi:CDP-diacylglycerol--glycerol-3-phosphate 3-phosphatidyltransferase
MLSLSNVLSFLRGPLALLLLIDRPLIRASVIFIAMLSDSFDGYLARNYNKPTRFGAILDPVMDKWFVFFALFIFCSEDKLTISDGVCIISRDIALIVFGLYLLFSKKWKTYLFSSVKWGKITTSLQFIALFLLSLNYPLPSTTPIVFVLTGAFVLIELSFRQYTKKKERI